VAAEDYLLGEALAVRSGQDDVPRYQGSAALVSPKFVLEGDRVWVLAGLGDMTVDDAHGYLSLSAKEATGAFHAGDMVVRTGVILAVVGGPSTRGRGEDEEGGER
jgi:hypothetical protein